MATPIAFLLGTCIIGAGVVFHIVGMATTHWMEVKIGPLDLQYGLFRGCVEDKCNDLENLRSQDKAVQAMAILGVLSGGAGVLAAVAFVLLTFVNQTPIDRLRPASALLCVGGSFFIFICVIVYGAKIYKDFNDDAEQIHHTSVSLDYSFGLSIVGGLLLLIGAGVVAANGRHTQSTNSQGTGTVITIS